MNKPASIERFGPELTLACGAIFLPSVQLESEFAQE